MKYRSLIFWLCLWLPMQFAVAQSPQELIGSLRKQLAQNPPLAQKAKVTADLAWYYNMVSIDSALYFGKQSIALAKQLKDDNMIGQALSDYGAILYVKGDYDDALQMLSQSYTIRKKLKDVEGMASLDFKFGNVYFKQFALKQAMTYFLRALKYYEKTGNAQVVGVLETNIAAVYQALKNYPKALEYLGRSEKYLTESKQEAELANTIVGIGNVYFAQKDTARAFTEFERGAKLAEKTQNFPAMGTAYNNLGLIYTYRKQPQKAIDYISKSLAIRKKINQTADAASSELSLAINHVSLGQFQKAKPLLLAALQVFERDSIREKAANTYIQLIPVYAALGKVDSVNFYTDKYLRYVDGNLNENTVKITNELEAKYQTAKKEKLLLEQQAESRRKTQLLLLVSLFALFVGVIGYLFYRQQKLKNAQQRQEHDLKLAIAHIETQNKLQEQRLSISRDLHDNIGAQLTFIISSVDNIKYGFNVENPSLGSKLDRISNFAKSTIVELRDTIWAMNSEAITFKDLELRIMNFIEKAKKAKEDIDFKFRIPDALGTLELGSVVGMNVYRTVQEAVNNAIKYASAQKIRIEVLDEVSSISIVVSDDGIGFDPTQTASGNGLLNMKKRILDIGGQCIIDSKFGSGTTVSLNIPKT